MLGVDVKEIDGQQDSQKKYYIKQDLGVPHNGQGVFNDLKIDSLYIESEDGYQFVKRDDETAKNFIAARNKLEKDILNDFIEMHTSEYKLDINRKVTAINGGKLLDLDQQKFNEDFDNYRKARISNTVAVETQPTQPTQPPAEEIQVAETHNQTTVVLPQALKVQVMKTPYPFNVTTGELVKLKGPDLAFTDMAGNAAKLNSDPAKDEARKDLIAETFNKIEAKVLEEFGGANKAKTDYPAYQAYRRDNIQDIADKICLDACPEEPFKFKYNFIKKPEQVINVTDNAAPAAGENADTAVTPAATLSQGTP